MTDAQIAKRLSPKTGYTLTEFAARVGLPKDETQRALARLKAAGVAFAQGRTRGARWYAA